MQTRTQIVQTTVLLLLLFKMGCLFAGATLVDLSDNSAIEQLYQSFLGNPNTPVFVAFEREMLVPERHEETRSVKLPDGKMAIMHLYGKDYFAFLRTGKHYLVAYSSLPGITNLSNMMRASRLAGYDGSEHWALDLGKAIQVGTSASSNTSAKQTAFERLTVISGDNEQLATNRNPVLQAIQGLATEGYSVANLGCSYPLTAAPIAEGANKLKLLSSNFDPLSALLSFNTDGGAPFAVEYHLPSGAFVNVGLDENDNAVSIKYSYNGKVFHSTRYHLLSVAELTGRTSENVFSWHHYVPDKSKVVCFLVADGVTSEAKIRGEKLIPIQKLYNLLPAARSIDERARWLIIFIFIAFSTITSIAMVRYAVKNKTKTEK